MSERVMMTIMGVVLVVMGVFVVPWIVMKTIIGISTILFGIFILGAK